MHKLSLYLTILENFMRFAWMKQQRERRPVSGFDNGTNYIWNKAF